MNANGLIRWTTVAAVVGIASVAAWVSYEHALAVVRAYGETGAVGYAYPATIDGLVYVSSMAMLDSARRGLRTPVLARWLLGAGIAATLVVNVLAGLHSGLMGSDRENPQPVAGMVEGPVAAGVAGLVRGGLRF